MSNVIDRLESLWRNAMPRLARNAEDQLKADVALSFAVRSALPDLLKVARAAKALVDCDCASLGAEIVGPDGRCAICTLDAAREPLYREVAE